MVAAPIYCRVGFLGAAALEHLDSIDKAAQEAVSERLAD